ncbi:CDP-diacylglycerol--serine O-phosphatidyltransferase [Chengkuizengella axinellae]|uniref:CDP-diacylglycerol--serine O-phosphatidyltransferase n=1 Tax=Chengkuizengella axinellae TaxID=3064388 RepID=A0ABT9J5U2_9BACL|nr:CDP-diacylglycerol--serine O-phosphatidyltransferase [Chengkuizengella sp. 2205SS18-9]MDP5276853.1 CDP-diacylglycerol--serine O-phosphatidyltransferase [Chengkuizengella sp. 2205SS18-9]
MLTKSLPSVFTVANLFIGITSIIFVFNNQPDIAALLVIVAMLTDGIDGRVARALNVQSEFGKELDSLSDVISFGVAPAFLMYVVAFQEMSAIGWIVTAIFPICGALRLARFNVVTNDVKGYFIGLPIPAAGGILSSMALFHDGIHLSVLVLVTIILSLLMVSNIKYPSLKSVGISKYTLLVAMVLVVGIVVLVFLLPDQFGGYTKYLFVPLIVYAVYGLKKNGDHLIKAALNKYKEARNNSL